MDDPSKGYTRNKLYRSHTAVMMVKFIETREDVKFSHKQFRRLVNNIEQLLQNATERYFDDLADHLAHQLNLEGIMIIKKKGNRSSSVPLSNEEMIKRWIKKKMETN